MGAYFYHTHITVKGFCGIILVVAGSLSYALERINANNKAEEEDDVAKERLLENDVEIKSESK